MASILFVSQRKKWALFSLKHYLSRLLLLLRYDDWELTNTETSQVGEPKLIDSLVGFKYTNMH